ncbi:MAG TPA: hypothetical protein VGG48_06830 [Rhizomicrobium sp.]|jgi:hypothetical protein
MSISRRSAMGYASAFAAYASNASASIRADGKLAAIPVKPSQSLQRLQHVVIHRDQADRSYAALLSLPSSDEAWMSAGSLDAPALQDTNAKYARRDYRLRRVNGFQTKSGMRYAAIWQWAPGSAAQLRIAMTESEFRAEADHFAADGYTLAHIDATATKSGTRYAAIWDKSPVRGSKLFTALSATEFKATRASLAVDGYHPRQVAGFAQNGRARFAAIFEKGATGESDHALPAKKFADALETRAARGVVLVDASGYVVAGRPFYTVIWDKA